VFSDCIIGKRQIISPIDNAIATTRYTRKYVPISDSANECTDWINPLRTTNVPKIASVKLARSSPTFHTLSMPRRSCTMIEWMNAVAVNHGSSETFSTGSQPQ
jgi:hypothetical protein